MINNENIVSELTLYPRWFKKKTSLCVSFLKSMLSRRNDWDIKEISFVSFLVQQVISI